MQSLRRQFQLDKWDGFEMLQAAITRVQQEIAPGATVLSSVPLSENA